MANQKTPKFLELDFNEYVATGIDRRDLKISPEDFWAAASEQRTLIRRSENQAIFYASVGLALILLALPTGYFGAMGSLILLATAASLTAVGYWFCKLGFAVKKWRRILTIGGWKSLEFRLESEFEAIFEQVKSGDHQILEIDKGGVGTFSSPVSRQPVAKTYGAQALNGKLFPSTLFPDLAAKSQKFLVIVPAPSGDWFNYFVWNEPIASDIEDLFDLTPDIYPGDEFKRHKAKIALSTIASFVIEQKLEKRKFNSKDVVVGQFQNALKLKAAILRQGGEITDLEEQQLCRLNITGSAPLVEVVQIEKRRAPKPEFWFLNMMSGDYDPILRPLTHTIETKFGALPTFVM